MKRHLVNRCLLAATPALVLAGATASQSARATPSGGLSSGSITGTITAVEGSSFTIQTPGKQTGVVNALTGAATAITEENYPYVWGGGHAQAGIASIGDAGHDKKAKRPGYDCSGAVAAVLVKAGLWHAGSGVPDDAGIITQLRHEGLIARGAGTGPVQVTLYDNPGVHIFMNIDGRFFGTSDGGGDGNPSGGAGWLADGAPDASSSGYRRYHFLGKALRGSTSAGHIDAFELDQLEAQVLQLEQTVRVSYKETGAGRMIASALTYPGSSTISGTIESLAPDGSSFSIQTEAGAPMTFLTDGAPELLQGIASGNTVQVSYSQSETGLTAHGVLITSPLAPTLGPTSSVP